MLEAFCRWIAFDHAAVKQATAYENIIELNVSLNRQNRDRTDRVCSEEGPTLKTSAKHHIPQADKHTISTLLIKPIFSVLAHAEKQFFFQN